MSGDTNRRWCAIESPIYNDTTATIQRRTSTNNSIKDVLSHHHQSSSASNDSTDADSDDQNSSNGVTKKPVELTLSYYKSPSSRDRSGWIFLSDVTNVSEKIDGSNRKWIQVSHPKRTFKFRGLDQREHDLWMKTLCQLCNLKVNKEESGSGSDDALGITSVTGSVCGGNGNESTFIGCKPLEPAEATYKKENLSYHESNSSVLHGRATERNHEAEIDFLRELTSEKQEDNVDPDPDPDPNPNPETYYYWQNEKVVVEEKVQVQEKEAGVPFQPSSFRGEIFTQSAIEQYSHTLLSQSTSGSKPEKIPLKNDDINRHEDEDICVVSNDHLLPANVKVNVNDVPLTTKYESEEAEKRFDQPTSLSSTGNSNTDHRMLQNINANCADGTIHMRLERAMLEQPCIIKEREDSVTNNCGDVADSRPITDTSKSTDENVIATMVQEISIDDEDSDSSFATSQSKLDDNSDSGRTMQALNGNTEEENNYFSYNSLLQLGDVSFDNDVLSLNHSLNEVKKSDAIPVSAVQREKHSNDEFHDSFLSPDEDFVQNNWDEEKSSRSVSPMLLKKQQLCTPVENSFDTDCSFRPDKDFVDADWDS